MEINTDLVINIARTVIIALTLYIILSLIIGFVSKRLVKKVHNKRDQSNIKVFTRVIRLTLLILILILSYLSLTKSWTLGITAGLLSAAIGWALQKPITGIAAWVMVVTKRPFYIGDRILIGEVKGDVQDISIMHVYINEIGGTIESEENSGRVVLIPNSLLFDQNIINYTYEDRFVLDDVQVLITYESNLKNAKKICHDIATKLTKEYSKEVKKQPHTKVKFQDSGLKIAVRYFTPAKIRELTQSQITEEIFNKFEKEKDIEIAYPHLEILHRKK